MAAPVWQLSVNLETKTATFTTGLADAAKSARGAFTDIKGGAGEMGRETSYSMMEARHSVMMLGEEFGVRLPRALSSFIAGLGPIGPALEMAFPFLAIAGLATILIEHLNKIREAGGKLTEDQAKFGITIQNVFNSLDQKLLQAEKRADELRGDHLGALHKELQLIDMQSMEELVHSFDEVSKAADQVFGDLKASWYMAGIGSEGAKHALVEFKNEYDSLLAQGKEGDAKGLLSGTLSQAHKVLDAFQAIKANQVNAQTHTGLDQAGDAAKYNAYLAARATLQQAGLKGTDDELKSQQALVQALEAQEDVQARVAKLSTVEKGNARAETAKEGDQDARKRMEEEQKAERGFLENTRQFWDEQVSITASGSQQKVEVLQAAMADVAALYGSESQIYQHYAAEQTKAIQEATSKQLEEIGKELDEEDKLRSDAAREQVRGIEDQLKETLKAQAAASQLKMKGGNPSDLADIGQMRADLDAEYAAKKAAYEREAEAYREAGMDQTKEAQSVYRQMLDADQQYQDQKKQLDEKEKADTRAKLLEMQNEYVSMFSHVLFGRESLTRAMGQMADQDITNAIKAALQYAETGKSEQLSAAKAAAAKAMQAVSGIPVVGPVLAPIAGAAVFAGAMAFEKGGIVPGVERGDIVPALLTPGEGVVPKGVMEGLSNMARNGGFDRTPQYHVTTHVHMNASALDSDGMEGVLNKHADTLQRHFENTLRKMNR